MMKNNEEEQVEKEKGGEDGNKEDESKEEGKEKKEKEKNEQKKKQKGTQDRTNEKQRSTLITIVYIVDDCMTLYSVYRPKDSFQEMRGKPR